MAKQTIWVGYPEYTYAVTITEDTGKDISGDLMYLGFSTSKASPPTTWTAPDIFNHPSSSSATLQILVGTTVTLAAGEWFLWVKVADSPELPPRYTGLTVTVSN